MNMLNLLPVKNIDSKIHRLIYESISSDEVPDLANHTNSKLFLEFSVMNLNYPLRIDTRKNGRKVLRVFQQTDLKDCVQLALKNAKQIEEAGIEVFWQATNDGRLELKFCVNLNKTAVDASDLEKKLHNLSYHKVVPSINKMLNEKLCPPQLLDFEGQEEEEEVNNKNVAMIGPFLEELEKATSNWEPSTFFTIRENLPSCHLMKYQKKTVQWMVKREQIPEIESLSKFPHRVKVRPPNGERHPKPLYYYEYFGIFSESDPLFSHFETKGGILADESGLGKTVEVISLILSHQKHQFYELPMSKNKKKKRNDDNEKNRECARCGEMVDLKKCGWQEEFDKANYRFQCVQCIAMQPPVVVKSTLIAVPEALMQHWLNEVIKNKLSYKVYLGMDMNGYMNPLKIADFDVILVSYEVLKAELSHTSKKRPVWDLETKSRRTKNISVTSLTHVNWWRVVFDESQLINKPSWPAAQMCQLINAENRWCVTGTPIENDFSDLFGLFKLIQFWPFNIEPFWKIVVAKFNDWRKRNLDLSKTLLIQPASQVMRRTKRSTVIDQMGIPKMVEIEQVVEFSPIEDYRYKKAMEDVKGDVKKAMDTSPNNVLMRNVKSKGQIFDIIGNLKDILISGGEHDEETRLKNIAADIHAEPKNCMIRQMNKKKKEIKAALPFTIGTLLNLAEVTFLENKINGAEAYADVANVFVMIDEFNKYTEQLQSPEIIELSDDEVQEDDDERIQKSNRKRGPAKGAGKPRKIRKLEDPEDKEKWAVEKKVEKEYLKLKQYVIDPISICETFTTRFFFNMLAVHKKRRNKTVLDNAINKLGGKDKLIANLSLIIERFSEDERIEFQIVRKEQAKLTEEWDLKKGMHTGISIALKKIHGVYKRRDPRSKSLATNIMKSSEAKSTMMDMSFWPVFGNSRKHFEDGKLLSDPIHDFTDCMGVCNNSTFQRISKEYQLSTNQELIQHVLNYINRLEILRTEVMKSYTGLISFFQAKYLDTIAKIPKRCTTLVCEHIKCSNVIYTSDEERHKVTNRISCLICSTKISLAHLSFELGVGSYHRCEREVQGKLPIEKFLEMLLAVEQKIQPASEQFDNFVVYIEELRRTVGQIQAGFEKIEEYSRSLHNLYLAQKPMDFDDLKCLDTEHIHRSRKSLSKCYLRTHIHILSRQEKELKALCGDLRYLITLYKKEGSNNDDEENICPICMDDWTNLNGFVGFPCGHRVCQNCYPRLRNQQNEHNRKDYIKCASCRKEFHHAEVLVARDKVAQNPAQSLVPGVNLTSKMREAIKLMREIIASGGDENVVLFTTSKVGSPMWEYLVDVFEKAELPFCEGTRAQRGSPFQFSKECRIILCSHDMNQMGLDFTNANHVIFLDPSHSFLVNDKAINRVVRFGQKRKVTVYHMAVESTLDDDIRRMCRAGRGKEWTVGDVRIMLNIKFIEPVQRDVEFVMLELGRIRELVNNARG